MTGREGASPRGPHKLPQFNASVYWSAAALRYGVYQIGEVYARSVTVIRTSGRIVIPKRFAS